MSMKKNYELLPALYMCVFQFIRPLTLMFREYSTLILFVVAAALCALAFPAVCREKGRITKFVFFCYFLLSYFLLEMLRGNELLSEAMYNFVIYGAVPVFLLIGVRDFAKLLRYYCFFALCRGIMYVLDPLNGYQWSGSYMGFGFTSMLPAVAVCTILLFYYKKKLAVIPLVIFMLELFICANKGAIITAVVLLVVSYVYFEGIRWWRVALIVVVAIVGVVIRMEILNILFDIAAYFDLNSYALRTFERMLTGEGASIYSVRTDLWEQAIEGFWRSPLIGMGEGWYEAKYGFYPHNVFMEVLVNTGLVGIVVFIVALGISIWKTVREKNTDLQLFLIIMLILWFLPCMVSLTFWSVMEFWVYFGLLMYTNRPTLAKYRRVSL